MSAFWEKKMKIYFNRIDFDKDGALTRKDFEGMAERFIEHGKFNDAKAKDLRATLTAVWDKYLSHVGGGDSIKCDAFVDSMKKLVKDPEMRKTVEGPLPLFFHAVDSNGDDQIDSAEYTDFFRILGLDPTLAPKSFEAIDTNHDGMLSLDEFKTAGAEFFFSEDEKCPTKCFWGPVE